MDLVLTASIASVAGFLIGVWIGIWWESGRMARAVLALAKQAAHDRNTRPMSAVEIDAAIHQADEDGEPTLKRRRRKEAREWRVWPRR